MTTPSFDLEALRALVEKMTPGPWCVDDHIVTPGDTPEEWHIYEQCEDDPPLATLSYIDAEANAAGIVALRNAFPALLDEVEARQREAREYADSLDRIREELGLEATHFLVLPDDVGDVVRQRNEMRAETERLTQAVMVRGYKLDAAEADLTDALRQRDEALRELRCPACGCATPEDADARECGCDAPVCAIEAPQTLAQAYSRVCGELDDLRARLAQAQSWEQTLRACLRGEQGYQQEDEDGNVVYEVNVAELREKLAAAEESVAAVQEREAAVSYELVCERQRLAAAERARKNHAETLIGIASMDPSDGKRMRMWAKDGLSGYKEPVESTVLKLSDERNAAVQRAEAAERSLAEANAYAEHEARTRRTIEKERDDAVSECGAAVVRAEAVEREIAAWERCAGIVVMAADGCDPDDRTPDALPRLVAGRITREEKRAEAAERDWWDLYAAKLTVEDDAFRTVRDGRERADAAERERDEAREFGEHAAKLYNDSLVLRCAFCGEAYPDGTPESRHERLTAHVAFCPEHPMRAVERERDEAIALYAGQADRAEQSRNMEIQRTEELRAKLAASDRRVEELTALARGVVEHWQSSWIGEGDEEAHDELVGALAAALVKGEPTNG